MPSSTPRATSATRRTAAASAPARRRSTCATSIPSARWCWSTACAGSTNPPPPASAAAPTSTPFRCRSSITSRCWRTAPPRSTAPTPSPAWSTSSPRRRFEGVEVNGLHRRVQQGRPHHRGQPHRWRHQRQILRDVRRRATTTRTRSAPRSGGSRRFRSRTRACRRGSSGTPQGRFTFLRSGHRCSATYGSCAAGTFYDVTLNNGHEPPVWDPNNPTGGHVPQLQQTPTASTTRPSTCC